MSRSRKKVAAFHIHGNSITMGKDKRIYNRKFRHSKRLLYKVREAMDLWAMKCDGAKVKIWDKESKWYKKFIRK